MIPGTVICVYPGLLAGSLAELGAKEGGMTSVSCDDMPRRVMFLHGGRQRFPLSQGKQMGSEIGVFGPQVQLLADIVPVGDHRSDGDPKKVGNLTRFLSLSDQLGDLKLFWRQTPIGGG